MLDLEKILDDWNKMTEDEKFAFIQFTYILCDYFGGDVDWCNRDTPLSTKEYDAAFDRLPSHLKSKIESERQRRDDEHRKTAFVASCQHILQKAVEDTIAEFANWRLTDEVKHRIMTHLSAVIETTFNDSWMKDTLELKINRVDIFDWKSGYGLIITFIHKKFKWTKVFRCWFENDNLTLKEIEDAKTP